MKTIQQQMKDDVNDIKSLILAVNGIENDNVRYEAADLVEQMLSEVFHFNQVVDTCVEEHDESRQALELAEQFFCSAWTGLNMAMLGTYGVTSAIYWAVISQILSDQACALTVQYRETLISVRKGYEEIMDQRGRLWSMAKEDREKQV